MARPRFDKLGPDKQETLLSAAADEFAEHGYRAASLNRIIERAGSSKGSFYYYFDDKADLLRTVLNRAVMQTLEEVAWPKLEELTAETYWERLRAAALATLPQMDEDSWHMRIMRSFYRLREEPEAQATMSGVLEFSRDLVRSILARGRELGVIRTDLPMDLLIDLYMAQDEAGDRWMLRRWGEFSESEKLALFEARLDLVRDMLDAQHVGWWR